MTKRHFEAIARGIYAEQAQYSFGTPEYNAIKDVAFQMCVVGHQFNDRFNQESFLIACGF